MGNIQKGVSSPHHDMHPAHQHPDSFFYFLFFNFLILGWKILYLFIIKVAHVMYLS